MKAIPLFLFFFIISISCSELFAQNDLTRQSFAELDTLYKYAKNPQEKISYALMMLKKGDKELDAQDTTYAKVLFMVGNTYKEMNDFQNASVYLQKALDIQKVKEPKSNNYALTLVSLGMVYTKSGQLEKSEQLFLKALAIQKEVSGEKHPNYIQILNNIGVLYKVMGLYAKAESFLTQALTTQKEIFGKNNRLYGGAVNNLGNLYRAMGDYAKAEQFYFQAINIHKEIFGKKHPSYAASLFSLANLYQLMGAYGKALPFYIEDINIMKEELGEKHPDYASSLTGLASIYGEIGDYAKAEQLHLQVLEIRKEVLGEKHAYYAQSLGNLGNLYFLQKDYLKAEQFYVQELKIEKEALGEAHPDYAVALHNLGVLYSKIGDYAKALPFYLQNLKVLKEAVGEKHLDYIEGLNSLGDLYKNMNQLDQAWECALLAIQFNCLGAAMQRDASSNLLDSLAKANYISFYQMDKSLVLVYDLLAKENNRKKQQGLICELALKLLERYKNELATESDKLRILSENSMWVLGALQILDKDKDAAKALDFVEKNKSVLLLDAMSNKQAYTLGLLPDSLIKQEKNLQKQYEHAQAALSEKRTSLELEQIQSTLANLNLEIEQFQKNIKKNYPKYADMKYLRNAIKADELQASLGEKTALLEYLISDSMVYVFYVDRSQIKIHEFAIDNKQLKQHIESFHRVLSDYKSLVKNKELAYKQYTQQANWFYQNLVAPALTNAKDIQQLIIISDGELGHLPFEAFLVETAPQAETDYKELHYLVKDYNISYNYSATLFVENKKTAKLKNNSQILAMASNYDILLDSTKSNWRLPNDLLLRAPLQPLPAARKEVEALQENFQGYFTFDTLASEKQFKEKAANYGVIHLAMHGLLNTQEQVLSSLAFTEISDSAENNFLCAYEISKMELNADLVVLSACETGFGKFEHGNGIASLARSFMYAGVPAMVVSLWQVNDFATAEIMKSFYNNLADGMAKNEALRQAKLQYMEVATGIAAHPAFWSPFIMMGNTEPVSIARKGSLLPWAVGVGILLLALGGWVLFKRTK